MSLAIHIGHIAIPELVNTGSEAEHRSRFCIGGVSVEVAAKNSRDARLVPSLEPFRVDTGATQTASHVNIRVEWVGSLNPEPELPRFDSGTTWRVYERPASFQFDFNAPVFGPQPYKRLTIDRHF